MRLPGARQTGAIRWSLVCWLAALAALAAARPSFAAIAAPPTPEQEKFFTKLSSGISLDRLQRHIAALSSIESRVVGYPGCQQARDYVRQQFHELGLQGVRVEEFPATVPVVGSAYLRVQGGAGKEVPLYPLWPNGIRTAQVPRGGLDLSLIYAGDGQLANFNGKRIRKEKPTDLDTAVMLDFNCASRWLNAARLGAKVVIFIEPEEISDLRGEAEGKFLNVPIDVQRFWIKRQDAQPLLALLESTPEVNIKLNCRMTWERRTGWNIYGRLEGGSRGSKLAQLKQQITSLERGKRTKAVLKKLEALKQEQATLKPLQQQSVMLTSYYDSMSMVPQLAPGAESASGIAALIELARVIKAHHPNRNVEFLATSGHFTALSGMRSYLGQHIYELQTGRRQTKSARFPSWIPGLRGMPWTIALALLVIVLLLVVLAFFVPDVRTAARWSVLVALLIYIVVGVRYTSHPRETRKINLLVTLDLSSRTPRTGIFYKGMLFENREDIQRNFTDLATNFRENANKLAPVLGLDAEASFADGINPIAGKPWRTFIPGKVALENECFTMGGGRGLALFTTDDSRPLVDTPADTIDQMNLSNLHNQVRLLSCLLFEACNSDDVPVDKDPRFTRMGLTSGFGELKATIVEFDPSLGLIPKKAVPGTLVTARMMHSTLMGVRGTMIEQVKVTGEGRDRTTYCRFEGIPTVNALNARRAIPIEAYHANPDTGSIDYAPDKGVTGAKAFPTDVIMTMGSRECTSVVFPCVSMAIYDLVDPENLQTLGGLTVYQGDTDAEPRSYGSTIATPEAWISHIEDVAMVFLEKDKRVKVTMSLGPTARRFVLLNSRPGIPQGIGFGADDKLGHSYLKRVRIGSGERYHYEDRWFARSFSVDNTPLQCAKDMWALDQMRIKTLEKFRIVTTSGRKQQEYDLLGLHQAAMEQIKLAEKALKQRDYATLNAASRAAWGYEARAYPDVQSTTDDVVKGVLFYLLLMLPFAFFCERLFFACPDLRVQILVTFLIFAGTVAIFRYIHPAFDISMNPVIVIIAFLMLALSVLVISLVTMRFEAQLKMLQTKMSGVHRADIGRMSVAAAAFSLGISNMRRRRARTFLTCVTLVLLTFVVISIMSVVSSMRYNMRSSPGVPRYNGLMIRNPIWQDLEESAYRVLYDEFGRTRVVAPRAWLIYSKTDEQTFIRLKAPNKSANKRDLRAVVGLSPAEAQVTRPQEALEPGGRWFKPGERMVAIIPDGVAQTFDIVPSDLGQVQVEFGGLRFTVIGIIRSQKLVKRAGGILDLDGEPLTPVDFIQMQKLQASAAAKPTTPSEAGFQEYIHLFPDDVIFIPYEEAMNRGGKLASVAINFVTSAEVQDVLKRLMPRLGFNLYAGENAPPPGRYLSPEQVDRLPADERPRINRWSSIGSTGLGGMGELIIPILIASLIVLNTMLGSVYERVREIGIFSAIGLAPQHIAMLFIAEAFVYSILGAIFGYLIGQLMTKVLVVYNIWPWLNLNYSSLSAVASTGLIIAVVLLSTVYPARKASEVATPAIERRWKVPEPVGDDWQIPLPFAVTGEQATALNAFMAEWFGAYEEYSIGDFVTQDVRTEDMDTPLGKGYAISLMAWLAPFDLGVSQHVRLETAPTDMEDVFEIHLTLKRESGDVSSWKRVNRRFLNTLRKQFLIWRTLRTEERERYLGMGPEATAEGAA